VSLGHPVFLRLSSSTAGAPAVTQPAVRGQSALTNHFLLHYEEGLLTVLLGLCLPTVSLNCRRPPSSPVGGLVFRHSRFKLQLRQPRSLFFYLFKYSVLLTAQPRTCQSRTVSLVFESCWGPQPVEGCSGSKCNWDKEGQELQLSGEEVNAQRRGGE